jgi:hypothetical protein
VDARSEARNGKRDCGQSGHGSGDLNSENRVFLTFRGRGRIDNDEAVRRHVFENSHPAEQERDKERKGVAIIIDLDSVEGLIGGSFVRLLRT